MKTDRERAIKIIRGLAKDLETQTWRKQVETEELCGWLAARLNREMWYGIELIGIPEIDEQVKKGFKHGEFGHYEGSNMGGRWWIDSEGVVDFKHTIYYRD